MRLRRAGYRLRAGGSRLPHRLHRGRGFFNRQTPFLRSPALIARFCACDILPGFFLRSPEGSYFNVWGEPLRADPALSPDDDARRIMSRVAADLEAVVRAHPTQWFNFYRFWNGSPLSS